MAIRIKKRFEYKDITVYVDEENEIMYCNHCGNPIFCGMTTDDWDFCVHEECFSDYMDEIYGKGKWKPIDESPDYDYSGDDGHGGYYIYLNDKGEWEGTGIYYTEWFDDYDAEFSYNRNRKDRYNFYVDRTNGDLSNINYIKVYTGTDSEGNEMFTYFYNPTEDAIIWEVND